MTIPSSQSFRIMLALMCAIAISSWSLADDKTPDSKQPAATDAKASKPSVPTFTVKQGAFKTELTLEGVFESKQNTEVTIRPKLWSDWTVLNAVSQGARVKQGDTLIEFDTIKIDEAIRDLEAGRKLADLSIEQLTAEIRLVEKSMPLDLQIAERASRAAETDLRRFLAEDREHARHRMEFQVKMTGNYLDYQKEELKQLEKMYKADDLTEETEEIILKRTRDEVESMEYRYAEVKREAERFLDTHLPRLEEQYKESAERTELSLRRQRISAPIALDRLRLELEKQKFEQSKSAERLTRLQHDRTLMKVVAPADGMVYYGENKRGNWQGAAFDSKLQPGGRVSSDEVVMTIVDPANLFVRVSVPEKDLWQLRRGMAGSVTPTSYGDQRMSGSIDELSFVPTPDGKFVATLLVDASHSKGELHQLVPGLHCSVKLATYSTDSALTLPIKAVLTDESNDTQRYVWLVDDEGKATRRDVTVGRQTASTVQIVDGLRSGDKVLQEAPKDPS